MGPIAAVVGLGASLWVASALLFTTTLALLAVPDIRCLPTMPAQADNLEQRLVSTPIHSPET